VTAFSSKVRRGRSISGPCPPADDEVGVVLARIAARVRRLLKRRGLDPGDADLVQSDPVIEESPALAGISSASIQGRIALGPRAGGAWGLIPTRPGCSRPCPGTLISQASICTPTRCRPPTARAWNSSRWARPPV
jgi:hypothetical protein